MASLRYLTLTFALVIAACGGSGGESTNNMDGIDGGGGDASTDSGDAGADSGNNDPDGGSVFAECTPDPDLIATAPSCRFDSDCPCGSSCDLGRCVAECVSDADCDGEACSTLGECGGSEPGERTLALGSRGELRADRRALPSLAVDEPFPVVLTASVSPIARFRLVASEGLSLECEGATEPTEECLVEDSLAVGSSYAFEVRATELPPEGSNQYVTIYTEHSVRTISVDVPEPPSNAVLMTNPAGVWRGISTRKSEGRAGEPGVPALRPQVIEIEMEIYTGSENDSAGVMVLKDPSRQLSSDGVWIGSLDLSGVDNLAVFPAYSVTGSLAGDPTRQIVSAIGDDISFDPVSERLSFGLRVTTEAEVVASMPLETLFQIELVREGDLPPNATAPSVPADDVLAPARADVFTPHPWESFVLDALTTPATLQPWQDRLEGTDRSNLATCKMDTNGEFLVQTIVEEEWLIGDATVPTVGGLKARSGSFGQFWGNALSNSLIDGVNYFPDSKFVGIRTGLPGEVSSAPWPRTDIPCEFSVDALSATVDNRNVDVFGNLTCGPNDNSTLSIPSANINDCAAMEQLYGCEATTDVVPWPSSRSVSISHTGSCFFRARDSSVNLDIQRVCRFPRAAPDCGESLLCNGTDTVAPAEFATGEFACGDGIRAAAVSADSRVVTSTGPVSTNEIFEGCLAEISDMAAGPSAAVAGDVSAALAPTACINPSRFFTSLGVALENVRYQDNTVAAWTEDADRQLSRRTLRNERIAARMIQRWLELHALLAHEAHEREVLAAVIREETGTTTETPERMELLQRSMAAWQLFYSPRFGYAIDRLDPDVLARPDWRADVDPSVVPEAHQGYQTGLPTVVLRTLEIQLRLAELHLERAAYEGNPGALDEVAELFHHVRSMRTWAAAAHNKASAHAAAIQQPLVWDGEYQQALKRLDDQHERTLHQAKTLGTGQNPLGVSESDLPLYFFGDRDDPNSRFSAVSDYLLGRTGTPETGWAQQAIDQATSTFEMARMNWDTLRQREWLDERTQAQQMDKEAEVRISYGDKINDLCFLDTASYDVLDLLTVRPETCFVNESVLDCQFDNRAWARSVTLDDIGVQLCYALNAPRVVPGARFDNDDLYNVTQLTMQEAIVSRTYDPECTEYGTAGCLVVETRDGEIHTAPISPQSLRLRLNGRDGSEIQKHFKGCQRFYPEGRPMPPAPDRLENPVCLRGAMGETVLTIFAAARDIEIAVAELGEKTESYDIAMNRCAIMQEGADKIAEVQSKHQKTMRQLRNSKLAADVTATIAGSVKDCLNSSESAAGNSALSAGASAGFAAAACAAGAVEATAEVGSLGIGVQIENAELNHAIVIDALERSIEIDVCRAEAEMELVGITAAEKRIGKATDDLIIAQYQLWQQKRDVAVLFEEGVDELERVRGRKVSPPTGELWLSDDVERFNRRMRLARRATYLAVRAVEYEYQTSLAVRAEVLAAETPYQLQQIVTDLRAASASRGIGGNRPTELKVVLSLKDNLLQIHDRSGMPDTWYQLTDEQRFREILTSGRYVETDETGAETGLLIPFQVAPLEALQLGRADGIGIFSTNDCAERIWSANASVVGSDNVLRGGATFTRMDLMKQNTFYSQSCVDSGFQVASVRPSKNLFREPGFGSDFGGSLGLDRATDDFTRARLQPAVNVPRQEFEDDAYANGQTSELAARGLYGEYALFIPANMLSRDDNGELTDGLDIGQLDDILIRFDYLSVAR